MVRRFLALFLVSSILAVSPALAFRNVTPGSVVDAVALPALDGGQLPLLGPLCQGATVVVFWASWSPRSVAALGDLQHLHRDYAGAGLRVVAVNVEGEETLQPAERDQLREVVGGQQVGYPVLLDPGLDVYQRWGVVAVPSIALVDGGGTVVEVLDGYAPRAGSEFLQRCVQVARRAGEDCVSLRAFTD